MRVSLWVLVVACFGAAIACNATPPPEEFRTTATIKDIMDAIVDPSADFLWDSVETIVSKAGIEEKAPHTDDEWKAVHRRAIELVEASNLLLIKGRHVAKAGEKSENKNVELEPEEIEKLINGDRKSFTAFALALHDAAVPALAATEARNAEALSDAGEGIDKACENCHLKYWYPNGGPPTGAVLSPRHIGGGEDIPRK
jgi:hypothetical protein